MPVASENEAEVISELIGDLRRATAQYPATTAVRWRRRENEQSTTQPSTGRSPRDTISSLGGSAVMSQAEKLHSKLIFLLKICIHQIMAA